MVHFAEAAESIAATTKKTEKVRITAAYLQSLPADDAARAALFLTGRAFPAWEETTLQVGGAILWAALQQVTGATDAELSATYRRYGDLGAAAADLLTASKHTPAEPLLTLGELQRSFRSLAGTRGAAAKQEFILALLSHASPLGAKYVVKIMAGEMRIGLRESLVEEAISQAFRVSLKETQRANMLLGSIGETLRLAAGNALSSARMRLFHPIGFMLASPAASAEEAFAYIERAAVEDKYDGIRAQAHISPSQGAKLFSRTLDEVTESFPELPPALGAFKEELILDGEIVAWAASAEEGSSAALPFFELQKRLGRKRVTAEMMRRVPVAYVVFDVLYGSRELLIDQPLAGRRDFLRQVFERKQRTTTHFEAQPELGAPTQPAPVLLAPAYTASSPAELEQIFEAALERGNEGLMIKDVASVYTPGRRGKSWLKLKRELATLDVVVTSVEFGHGRRAGVLSDYTFAVSDGEGLLNVGKAYSGLTDVEIAEMTEWFRQHTIEDFGHWRRVEPSIVIEVAFNAVMKSDRHASGFALRFPRILRLRPDKPVREIDTLARVREIYAKQMFREADQTSAE